MMLLLPITTEYQTRWTGLMVSAVKGQVWTRRYASRSGFCSSRNGVFCLTLFSGFNWAPNEVNLSPEDTARSMGTAYQIMSSESCDMVMLGIVCDFLASWKFHPEWCSQTWVSRQDAPLLAETNHCESAFLLWVAGSVPPVVRRIVHYAMLDLAWHESISSLFRLICWW